MVTEKKQSQNTPNEVVITVYVESSRTRSSSKLLGGPTKKTKPHPHFTQGCDRRAQLLAYSRLLRNEGNAKVRVQLPCNQSRPRSKRKIKSMLKKLSCKEI